MFDVITFGSASHDIFLRGSFVKKIKRSDFFLTGKGACFNLGSKIDVEEIFFYSGGGGTNTAVGFAKQGLKTAYCGTIGADIYGKEIINELKEKGIDVRFVFKTKKKPTNQSVIINIPNGERTIFVYRGASEVFSKKEIRWLKETSDIFSRTKWFYFAPLSGQAAVSFEEIVKIAQERGIKTAVNPSRFQLEFRKTKLKKIFKKIDVLILNQEEASLLTGIPYSQELKIFKKIDEMCDGIVVMTKGEKGVSLSDGKHIYRADAQKVKVVDKTGAGDAFSSGFISSYIKTNNIISSIQLGIANAGACIKKIGAKTNLLSQYSAFKKIKVKKTNVS